MQGQKFHIDDKRNEPNISSTSMTPWTGRTIFLVDENYTDRWGTDQRRQSIEASNLIYSQSEKEKEFDLFEEEAHSTKSRWTALDD